jgi:hypothetical protein
MRSSGTALDPRVEGTRLASHGVRTVGCRVVLVHVVEPEDEDVGLLIGPGAMSPEAERSMSTEVLRSGPVPRVRPPRSTTGPCPLARP